ncbi:MAG: VanZ family protein [Vicinamibacterales bacterium]
MIGLWLPVVAWMAAIYYGAGMSQVPGPAASLSDTFMHMSGYAGLAVLTLRATAKGRWAQVTANTIVIAFAIATLHGLSVEWEQMYIPSRMAEWRDVGNDILGALIGLVPAWAWATMRPTTRGPHDL